MFYERKIKYLDYLQNAERQYGAGFVKIEVRETVCNIAIQVSGLPQALCGEKDVFLTDGRKEGKLGSIRLEQGRGSLTLQGLQAGNIGCSGISYENLRALNIPIGAGVQVRCVWSEAPIAEAGEEVDLKTAAGADSEIVEETASETVAEAASKVGESADSGIKAETASEAEVESDLEAGARGDSETGAERDLDVEKNHCPAGKLAAEAEQGEMARAKLPKMETESTDKMRLEKQFEESGEPTADETPFSEKVSMESEPVQENFRTEKSFAVNSTAQHRSPAKRPVHLRESKWKQLSDIYPHIQPFQDKRDYLSIGPADFVIFPEKYYRMANNSFLLHGYYNYEHLILARMEKRGETAYYIGVPGNFYEREKQVAVMFGFESFECMEEPARQGDFGYYMMRVEL